MDHKKPLLLEGTFFQPYLGGEWTESEWDAEYQWMRQVGMNHLILQWSADSEHHTAAFPTALPGFRQSTQVDVVRAVLEKGVRYEMDTYIGLHLNHEWFGKYTNDPAWLEHEADIACQLAEELWERYGDYASFTGWYLSFEPDNVNQLDQVSWDRSVAYYQKVGGRLKSLTPGKPVMVAPFFVEGAGLSPAGWGEMWRYILTYSPIDIFNLQDGVGAAHALPEHLPAWYEATKKAIDLVPRPVEFWSDTETFRTMNGRFVPVEFPYIHHCMELVAPYVTRFSSFSFNHYMSPQQVDRKYYELYVHHVRSVDQGSSS